MIKDIISDLDEYKVEGSFREFVLEIVKLFEPVGCSAALFNTKEEYDHEYELVFDNFETKKRLSLEFEGLEFKIIRVGDYKVFHFPLTSNLEDLSDHITWLSNE